MTLATIQEIKEIRPIPDANQIETAVVLGWQVVVKKGEFVSGDLCIYLEIDALLPRKDWSEFLFKPNTDDKQYRLRTVRLRKVTSQGLVLPISILDSYGDLVKIEIGADVTPILGIEKYEKQLPGSPSSNWAGTRKGRSFPSFLRKTDEVRIQSEPWLLENLHGKSYYITQKLDGMSASFFRYNGKFGVCSRNMLLLDPRTPKGFVKKLIHSFKIKFLHYKIPKTDVYWNMVAKYHIEEWLPEGYAIQGEICGPGIQGNKVGLESIDLFIFNIWDINNQKYESPFTFDDGKFSGVSRIFTQPYNMLPKFVPPLSEGSNFNMKLDELLEKAKGNYPNGTPQEGIVIRSIDQMISFKVVNNEFLLLHGE
jgi:RNA ligase (TIGR02306 family)